MPKSFRLFKCASLLSTLFVFALVSANATSAELQPESVQRTAPPELTNKLVNSQAVMGFTAQVEPRVEPQALEVIKTEGFEGLWPNDWLVFDNDGATNGELYWINDSTRAANGSWSGWCAGGGANGVPGGSEYANNMDSWMVYGPFSLADATTASASLAMWLDSEASYDFFAIMASSDGASFSGFQYSGSTGGAWQPVDLDMGAVGMLGETDVWLALVFTSDEIITAGGAYVDDIEVSKDTAALDFDLELSEIDVADGTHAPGTWVDVYTEAQNLGPDASTLWSVDYYLSVDGTITGSDIYLGSLIDLDPLSNGEVWGYPVGVPLPAVEDGAYYVGAIVPTIDSNPANNTAIDAVPIIISSEPAISVRPTHLTLESVAPEPGATPQEDTTLNNVITPKQAALANKPQAVAALMDVAQQKGKVRVIVGLDTVFVPEGRLNAAQRSAQRQAIGAAQSQLATSLQGFNYTEKARYRFIPYVALSVNPQALQALANNPRVTSIQEDRTSVPLMESSNDVIASPLAWMGGFDGSGQAVAIMDTGVDTSHSWFTTGGSRIVSEACYSSNGDILVSLCPGEVESSTEVGSGVNCVGVEGCDHGTHVAGTVAGNDFIGPDYGVARGANLIAMQVFTKITDDAGCGGTAPCVVAFDSDLLLGLQRVQELSASIDIASVNMSLGGGQFFDQPSCDAANVAIKDQIDNLVSVDIATVIASGNDGWTDSMGSPGCISSAISVGATTDSDDIAGFSNITSFIDLLAPGTDIMSSVPGGTGVKQGTSMATPHVAGAWALLKQFAPGASVAEIRTALYDTGTILDDLRPGGSVVGMRRINVDLALAGLGYQPSEFGIFNPGYGSLAVTAITPSIAAPWLTLSTAGPLDVEPGRMYPVDVSIDFASAPSGTTQMSLFVDSNAPGDPQDLSDRTVYLEVINVAANEQPVADPQSLETPEDVELPITLTGSDGNGDSLTFMVTEGPINGGLLEEVEGDGSSLIYQPFEDFNGEDSFTFVANDGLQDSEPAMISINVTSRNDPPWFTAEGDKVWLPGETGAKSHPGWVTSLFLGPDDEASQVLLDYHVSLASDPAGVLSALDVSNDGTLDYTLTGASGVASFTIAAQDDGGTGNGGQDTSSPVAFSINVMYEPLGKLDTASYTWLLHTPAMFTPQEICCFDYDGDAAPDDAWGVLADLVEGMLGTDANAELATQIAGADIVKLMFWSGLPALGEAGVFELEFGNGRWQGVADFPTRVAGQGEFSYDSNGLAGQPPNTIAAEVDALGNISGVADTVVSMPLVLGRDSNIIDVPLNAVQVEGQYSDERLDCDGVCSVDESWDTPPIKGGLKLGGLMHLDDYFAALEQDWQSCLCTGQGNPLFEYGENVPGGNYIASCTDTATENAGSCPACSGLSNICQFSALIPVQADIDSNDNGINDSFSVGLRIGFSGATIVGCEGDSCPGVEPKPDVIFSNGFE